MSTDRKPATPCQVWEMALHGALSGANPFDEAMKIADMAVIAYRQRFPEVPASVPDIAPVKTRNPRTTRGKKK